MSGNLASQTGARVLARAAGAWPLIALALLLAFNAVFTPGFASIEVRDGRLFGAMVNVLKNGSIVVLLATGMTLVIASGGIDLSVGSVMALSGTVAALCLTLVGWPVGLCVLGGLAAGVAVGMFNAALVQSVGLQPIIATLVTLVAGRGIAQTLTHDQKVRFENTSFEWIGTGAVGGVPTPILIAVVVVGLVLVLLRVTVLGMYVEALGVNPRAARLCGLPVPRLRLFVYAASGACAALAGLIATADIKEADVANCGMYAELDAILAVVIGGTNLAGGRPRVLGAVVGALLLQTLTISLQMRGVSTEHALVVKAVVAIAVCLGQAPRLALIGLARRGVSA